jgi:DNA-binding HxlR family transcriptional regulator
MAGGCPLEPVVRMLAGTWTLRILWFLDQSPRGFADLQRDLGRVSPKVLSERLKQMEARGIVSRTWLDERRRFVQYALTPLGREFRPVLEAMCQVAQKMQ